MKVYIPIGVSDRNGVPIHVGDRLVFDATEWGSPHVFKIELDRGQLLHDGAPGDLSEWCEVIDSPGWEVTDIPFDAASGRTAEEHLRIVVRVLASKYTRKRRKLVPFWADVCDVFVTGSTSACQICRRCGYDPHTGKKLEGGAE